MIPVVQQATSAPARADRPGLESTAQGLPRWVPSPFLHMVPCSCRTPQSPQSHQASASPPLPLRQGEGKGGCAQLPSG